MIELRVNNLPPYPLGAVVQAVNDARIEGRDIIDFSQINPDFAPNGAVLERLVQASLLPHNHRYSSSQGISRLREEISKYYRKRFDVECNPDREVVVTMGSKEGINHLLLGICGQGDVVLLPTPSYPIHQAGIFLAGAQCLGFSLLDSWDAVETPCLSAESEGFFSRLASAYEHSWPRPKCIIVNFPHNPTGVRVELSFYQRLVDFALERTLFILHDFAYADVYAGEEPPPSILSIKGANQIAIEFYSISKGFGLPGWRAGFAVGAEMLVSSLKRVKSYYDFGVFQPLQIGLIEAMKQAPQITSEIRTIYHGRAQALKHGLKELDFNVYDGGVFLWARAPESLRYFKGDALGSYELAKCLLDRVDVAVCPGEGFCKDAKEFVRFALGETESRCLSAITKIAKLFLLICVLGVNFSQAEDCPKATRLRVESRKENISNVEKEEKLKTAIELCPDFFEAMLELGIVYSENRNFEESNSLLEKAQSMVSGDLSRVSLVELALANTQLLQGELDGAEKRYQSIIDKSPKDEAKAQQGLAAVYEKRQDLPKAEEAIRHALQIDPTNPDLYYSLGLLLEKMKRIDDAISSFQTALEKAGGAGRTRDVIERLVPLLVRSGKSDQALRALEGVLLRDPKYLKGIIQLSSLQIRKGDFYSAQRTLQKFDNFPEKEIEKSPEIIAGKVIVLFSLGSKDEALQQLEKAHQSFPHHPLLQSIEGWIYLKSNEVKKAEELLRPLENVLSNDAFYFNNIGVLSEIQGKNEEAIKHYKHASELDSTLNEASENLSRLKSE